MNLPALTAFGLAYCVAAPLAHADGAGLLRCRAHVDGGARLACYDALPVDAATATGARSSTPADAAPAAATVAPHPQGDKQAG